MYNCLPPSQLTTAALQLFTAFLLKIKNNGFISPKSTSTGVLLRIFIFQKWQKFNIAAWISLVIISQNKEHPASSLLKSGSPKKAKNTLFRKSFPEPGFSSPFLSEFGRVPPPP